MSILKVDTLQPATASGVHIAGHVIQVKYYQSPTGSSGETLTTSTSYVASGVLLDFTPKFASSLIIVKAVVHAKNSANTNTSDGVVLAIYKDGSTRLSPAAQGDAFEYNSGVANHNSHGNISIVVSETAGNTTSRQYRVYYRSFAGNSSGLNYDWGNQTMTVMEIAQ